VCVENIYFWTHLNILKCHYNIWKKKYFYQNVFLIFLSQYCEQKCLVCISPEIEGFKMSHDVGVKKKSRSFLMISLTLTRKDNFDRPQK